MAMEQIKFVARIVAALAVYLFGVAIAMGACALCVSVGWHEFGLRGGAMLAFSMIGIVVGGGLAIAFDNIAGEIAEGR